jgi:hypothetical protein
LDRPASGNGDGTGEWFPRFGFSWNASVSLRNPQK